MDNLYESVAPVIMLALHRMQAGSDMPEVLFVEYKEEDGLKLPYVKLRNKEQPYRGGLRILNSSFELGITNVRLRCYYTNRLIKDGEKDDLVVYYALKMREEEVELLEYFLSDIENTRFKSYKWLSVDEEDLSEEVDETMRFCWEHLRFSVASNYGIRVFRRRR